MNKACASCPASLSFIFKIIPNNDLIKMGSVGVGCTVDKKVSAEVEKSQKTEIYFNGKRIKFPTVSFVLEKLTTAPVRVSIESSLPLGHGFGISGAAALAAAISLNQLLHLKKTKFELVKIVHVAEIVNRTGLGSVATQATGGFLLKKRPGLPVEADKLPFAGNKLYAVIIDRLLTPSILENKKKMQKVSSAADFYLNQLKQNKQLQLADILDVSFNFVTSTGLLTDKRVINIIDRIKKSGGNATMAILGKVVVANIKPTFIKEYRLEELTVTNDHL